MSKERIILHEIILENLEADNTRNMYYRSDLPILRGMDGGYLLEENGFYDFSTYFNSLSCEKWNHYTIADNFCLEFDVMGEFVIELMGHYVNSKNQIQKEWLGRYYFNLKNRKKIALYYPDYMRSMVVSFQIKTIKDMVIYSGCYSTMVESDKMNTPSIGLVTTTFKKEPYILRNIKVLKKSLFSDHRYADHFTWKIIDNGSTLDAEEINDSFIEVIPNKNVGGSGGFTRGMMETLVENSGITHVLLMDDDVLFFPDSFKRIYTLLSLLKKKFQHHFISGAMLEINEMNIQHEDIGYFSLKGEHGPVKPRYDLNMWDSVIRNETMIPEDVHQYSGWWYCCIPTGIADKNNLPLPFFIRGDDVEYSIRNHAKFITMNGICIWHEGFGNKFSGALELYQVHRNDLILQAMHEEISDIKLVDRITNLFWEEMYKFNYKGASLLIEAVEDYLKGPDFIRQLDGEKCMKEKKEKDNVLFPITEEVRRLIPYETLYQYIPLKNRQKKLYDYTYNGQRLPKMFSKRKIGIIPYGWGYYQQKQYMTRVNYAIDPVNDLYAVYKRSDEEFRRLKQKFLTVMEKYRKENKAVVDAYRNSEKELESCAFWKEYLK